MSGRSCPLTCVIPFFLACFLSHKGLSVASLAGRHGEHRPPKHLSSLACSECFFIIHGKNKGKESAMCSCHDGGCWGVRQGAASVRMREVWHRIF
uniref:Secreted protein n=1 Tax=Falco tinnunculus TaxID=100819 RepID=A0A8C4UA00_FALTI